MRLRAESFSRLRAAAAIAMTAATLCVGSLLQGCTEEQSAYTDIPERGWVYGDALVFLADSAAVSGGRPSMSLSLTHNNDYPYRNLWVEAAYLDTDSATHRDTLNIELCDRYGRWFGKGFGATYQIEVPVNYSGVPAAGAEIRVRHIMRVDTLRGLEKMGLSIKPASEPR